VPDIYGIAAEFRRQLLEHDRAVARELIDYYGGVYRRLQQQTDSLMRQIADARERGEEVSPAWLYRAERLRLLQDQVQAEMQRFADYAGDQITEAQRAAVEMGQQHAEQLALAGLGEPPPGVIVTWARLPRDAVTDLVGFLHDGSPLRDLLDELGPEASRAVRDALVAGVATGQNPRVIARQIRQALGGNLVRALRISRTEILRSYREASHRSYQANDDIMEGWIWHSAKDRRTCMSCIAMHGTKHRLDERLDDHVSGRCTAIPLTKSWEEILGSKGRDIQETRPQIELGADWFARQPEDVQRAMMGPAKYAAWKSGAFDLEDLVGRTRDPRWGTMRHERSLRDILGEQAGQYLDPVRRAAVEKAAATRAAGLAAAGRRAPEQAEARVRRPRSPSP